MGQVGDSAQSAAPKDAVGSGRAQTGGGAGWKWRAWEWRAGGRGLVRQGGGAVVGCMLW